MEGYSEEASLLQHLENVASEEEEVPLVVYLKENAALLTANGLHLSQTREAQQSPLSPSATEVHGPAVDVNQNLSSPCAMLTTSASTNHHNQPAADVNQNPPAAVTSQNLSHSMVQQNSFETQCPPNGMTPDFKPSTSSADRKPQMPKEEVRSSILLIDKVSAPPTATNTFSREATPLSNTGPPATDLISSSLLIDVQPSTLVSSAEQEMSGCTAATTPTKVYSEVHLTLAKPPSVVNRTARPFGIQSGTSQMEQSPMIGRKHLGEKVPAPQATTMVDRSPRPQRHTMSQSPMVERRLVGQRSPHLERRPLGNFTPPPTYAETLSTAPLASRVRSPPSYSALYPSSDPKPSHLKGQAVPTSKTGILEESMARRGSRKSMFTFVEKPKVTPNPDLLDLVQTADEKRRQRDHGEAGMEEEPFALGAEASNFQQEPVARDRASPAATEEAVPEWASCLKSPRIQAKPKPKPNQNLSEASGKGAELYARRQSRMEKYVIESSGPSELARCPSPTMSLPSSWKYSTNAPGGFRVASLSPARTPPASLYHGYLPENGVLRPEPTKQQPYQMRPSLFVLSPIKEPGKASPRAASSRTASPRAASPAKPSTLDLVPNLPRVGLPPSPALSRPSRSSPGLQPSAVSPTYSSDISPVSPSRGWSPRAKQAPRPSFSTRNAGIEAQDRPESQPISPPWTPGTSRPPSSLDGWVSPGPWEPGRGSSMSSPPPLPPPPMSPSWSERSVSPLRPESGSEGRPPSRQLQALLARNIINAARRKSASPRPAGAESLRPFSPPRAPPSAPPRMRSPQPARPSAGAARGAAFTHAQRSPLSAGPLLCSSPRSPETAPPRPIPYRRSPTNSDVSLDSEDSGNIYPLPGEKGSAAQSPQVPFLDLGKKLSVPQDLMIEELSLRNNRGSLLFQKRQRRVQKFTFELSDSQQGVVNGLEKKTYGSKLHVFLASPEGPGGVHSAAAPTERVPSPRALAPGYAEPLKGVPPEKFNHTAIPKGYHCPWQEFISHQDYTSNGQSYIPSFYNFRNFNKTPVPFGGPLLGESISQAGTPFIPEPFSGLELLRLRPSFNRVAQGWVRKLPESEEL